MSRSTDRLASEAWRALASARDLDSSDRARFLAVIQRGGGHPLHGAWCKLAWHASMPDGARAFRPMVNIHGDWWRLRAGGDRYWPTVGPPAKRAQKGGGRPTTWDGDRGTDWFQWEASSQVEAVRLMLDWLAGRLTELRPPEWRPGQA